MKKLTYLFLLCGLAALGQSSRPNYQEKAFQSGGSVRLELSAADYDIRAAADNQVHVSWRADDPAKERQARVTITTQGAQARIVTDGPHNGNLHFEIEVPKVSDLMIKLSAGDLRIGAIEGSKDIDSNAGDIQLAVGDPQNYASVDVKLTAGDLNAQPFGGAKDGLFRSFHWTGKGKYRLNIHLMAGDINLVEASSI